MYELIQVGGKSYYINCPAKIGLYRVNNSEVYLIDSGNDKDAGRKVRQILDKNAWTLKAILNTHSNADHIGGNQYLQKQTGCDIFANGIEADFTKHPILEPSFLYGGYPFEELRHKFLLAQKSMVLDFAHESFPKEIEVIPLPGHFFDMVGFQTKDQVVYLADCISSAEILDKYGIPFIYDVESYLRTLDQVGEMKAVFFVPAHAQASSDIKELVEYNKSKVLLIKDRICDALDLPITFELLLQKIFQQYQLTMDYEQYVLVGSTIRSFLSWLKDNHKISALIQDNQLLWQRI